MRRVKHDEVGLSVTIRRYPYSGGACRPLTRNLTNLSILVIISSQLSEARSLGRQRAGGRRQKVQVSFFPFSLMDTSPVLSDGRSKGGVKADSKPVPFCPLPFNFCLTAKRFDRQLNPTLPNKLFSITHRNLK